MFMRTSAAPPSAATTWSEAPPGLARLSFEPSPDRRDVGAVRQRRPVGRPQPPLLGDAVRGGRELGVRDRRATPGASGETISSSSVGPLVNLQVDWRSGRQVSAQLGRWLTPSGNGLSRYHTGVGQRLRAPVGALVGAVPRAGLPQPRGRRGHRGLDAAQPRLLCGEPGSPPPLTEWWELQKGSRPALAGTRTTTRTTTARRLATPCSSTSPTPAKGTARPVRARGDRRCSRVTGLPCASSACRLVAEPTPPRRGAAPTQSRSRACSHR